MVKKKPARKKKIAGRNKPTLKKKSPTKNSPAKKKPAAKKKPIRRKRKKTGTRAKQEITNPIESRGRRGLGSATGGQSGDTQGLSRNEDADSESVEELAEEGQYFEAEAVSGVENAKDPDESEVTTSEVPEDDVPLEYRDRDKI
jgi:hypothetical protein